MKIQRSSHAELASLYRGGESMREIAERFSVSPQRVSQIIRKAGFRADTPRRLGRRSRERQARVEQEQKSRDNLTLARFGCTYAEYRELLAIGRRMRAQGAPSDRTPARAWQAQRQKARIRCIPWEISLWDWWMVWKCSGKWDERGRGTGYMMCRFGDEGPYSLDNIYIATGSHNASMRKYLRDHPHEKPGRMVRPGSWSFRYG